MNLATTHAISLLTHDEEDRLDSRDLVETMDTDGPPPTVCSVPPTVCSVPRNGSSGPVVDLAPARPCPVGGRPADVRAAGTAVRTEDVVAVGRHPTHGRPVRLFAEPYFAPDTEGDTGRDGAVVPVRGASSALADHRRTAWPLSVGCAVLVCLSASVGRVPSGRAVRPASTTLRQQGRCPPTRRTDSGRLAAHARRDGAVRGTGPEVPRRTPRPADGMGGLVGGPLTPGAALRRGGRPWPACGRSPASRRGSTGWWRRWPGRAPRRGGSGAGRGSSGPGLSIASWGAPAHGGSLFAAPGGRDGPRYVPRPATGGLALGRPAAASLSRAVGT
ncbi:sensor histidine kinase [Streptomyces lateritius]|uniref:Sensor histidine kinase n=1 Tax=Streptomyces lateritius TaxID=67313 RepID=A0ABW6Y807_9ACTN